MATVNGDQPLRHAPKTIWKRKGASAWALARQGQHLLSEYLTVCGRAEVGKAMGGVGEHWGGGEGVRRLEEVAGRMQGGKRGSSSPV